MSSSLWILILLAAGLAFALLAASFKKTGCPRCQMKNLSCARYCAQCGARLRTP